MLLNGMRVVEHSLAVRLVGEIQRHPIRKRRRNWRPVAVQRPAVFQVGGTLYMHPDLYAKLKHAAGVRGSDGGQAE